MTLTKLMEQIAVAMKVEKNPDRIEVVVPVQLPYMTAGAQPCVPVDRVNVGFDHNAGKFFVVPRNYVMCVKHDVPQMVIEWNDTHICPKCQEVIAKKRIDESVRFCKYCGTAIKWHAHSEDEP